MAVEVGGDTSVRWNVDVRNLRPGSSKSEMRDGVFHQEGIDETDDGAAFTITIKLPRVKAQHAQFLKAVALAVRKPVRNRIVIKIPIEPGNMNDKGRVNQVRIDWPSSKKVYGA